MTADSVHARPGLGEWEPAPAHRSKGPALLTLIGAVTVLGCLAAALVAAGAPAVVVAGGAILVVAGICGCVFAQGRLLLSNVKARPVAAGEHPRLANLMDGLAGARGIGAPSLHLHEGAANVLVCWKGGAVAAFSSAFLSSLSRTELEAVAAHCLVRAPHARALNLAAAFPWIRSSLAACDPHAADRAAVAATRYPPALASALGKAEPCSTRSASFWLVPSGDPGELADRVAQLLDL